MENLNESIWGIRNKDSKNHWKHINIEDYSTNKPTLICLSGNGCVNDKEANGFCKFAESLLGVNIDDGYEDLNIIGVSYGKNANNIGKLSTEEVDDFVKKMLIPKCFENGKLQNVDKICENLSKVTFLTYCHGTRETYNIMNTLAFKLQNEFNFTESDIETILGSMREICYSPEIENSAIPRIEFLSMEDRYNGTKLFEHNFGNDSLQITIENKNRVKEFDNLCVFSKRMINIENNPIRDEHFIDFLERDSSWKCDDFGENANCVSQIMAYALAKTVGNSINNYHNNIYNEHLKSEELAQRFNRIKCEFSNESLDSYEF